MSNLLLRGRKCHTYVPYIKRNGEDERVDVDANEPCWCSGSLNDHRKKIQNNTDKWDIDLHTKNELAGPNDSNDRDDLTPNIPKYVRCDIKTDPKDLEKLLLKKWHIEQPQLFLSIIGGAKYFKLSDHLEEKVCDAIIDATRQSNAWLLTSGFNVGIVQMVGQALRKIRLTSPEENIVAIAVTKYGCVANDSKIIKRIEPMAIDYDGPRRKGEHGLEPNHTHYILLDDGTKRRYDMIEEYVPSLIKTISKGQSAWEMSVPAVTLVVGGGHATIKSIYYSLSCGIPVVLIKGSGRVADFFTNWLSYLKDNLNDDRKTGQKSLMKGIVELNLIERTSKKSSLPLSNQKPDRSVPTEVTTAKFVETATFRFDLHNPILDKLFEEFKDNIFEHLRHVLTHQSEELWQTNKPDRLEKRVKKIYPYVIYCLQPAVSSDISFFDLNDGDNLTDAILKSFYHARRKEIDDKDAKRRRDLKKKKQTAGTSSAQELDEDISKKCIEDRMLHDEEMLKLALQWNCLEVAKELIVRGSIENIRSSEQKKAVFIMLRESLPAFLNYFITLGVSLPRIIFEVDPKKENIDAEVYNNTMMKELYSIQHIKDIHKKRTCLLYDMIKLKIDLEPEKKELCVEDLNQILQKLIGDNMEAIYPHSKNNNDNDKNAVAVEQGAEPRSLLEGNIIKTTYRDLFIWAILMNYIDMAKMLLSHINHRLCAAVIARKILKSFHDKYALYSDKKAEYMKSMNDFEDYAIEFVNLCYKNNPDKACELVLRQCEIFGNVTCLQLAFDGNAKRFLGQTCCVQAISNVWHGMIDNDQTSFPRILVTVLSAGLFSSWTISFRQNISTNVHKQRKQLVETNLEYYGITYPDSKIAQRVSPTPLHKSIKTHIYRFFQFHQSPVAKFAYDCIHYVFILLLFSYVMLFKFNPRASKIPSIDWTEILLIILVTCMVVGELRLFFTYDASTLPGKTKHYFSSWLKIFRTLSYLLFYIGVVLRLVFTEPPEKFDWARIIMGYTLQIWWLGAIKYIIAVQYFGPHIVAIRHMLNDLIFFMCLIAIVMIGYGTASRAIAYYGCITTVGGIFSDMIYPVYYLLYSQLDKEKKHLDKGAGTNWSIAVHILLAINMLLIVILFTNLLIAMFNKRFDKVYEDAQNVFHYQKYRITREYFERPSLFPPLNIFSDLYKLLRMLINRIQKKKKSRIYYQMKVFKMVTEDQLLKNSWDEFEGASTYEYAQEVALKKQKKTEQTIRSSNTNTKPVYSINEKKLNNVFENAENTEKSLETMFDEFTLLVNQSLKEMKLKLASENKPRSREEHSEEKETTMVVRTRFYECN